MPFDDDRFDVVTSTFGAFLADDPYACAAEVVRVCRPGGTIALTAWTRDGPFEALRDVVTAQLPELPTGQRPDFAAWAEAEGLRDRFGGTGAELVDLDLREVTVPFASVNDAIAFYERTSGPMILAREAAEALGHDWGPVRQAIAITWSGDGHVRPADSGVELVAAYRRALLRVAG